MISTISDKEEISYDGLMLVTYYSCVCMRVCANVCMCVLQSAHSKTYHKLSETNACPRKV